MFSLFPTRFADVIGLIIGLRVVSGHSSISLSSLFVLEKRSAWNIDLWELGISSGESIRRIREDFPNSFALGKSRSLGRRIRHRREVVDSILVAEASSSCDGSMVSIFAMPSTYVRGYNCLAHYFYFLDQCIINKIGRWIGNLDRTHTADEKYGGSSSDTEGRRKLSGRKLYSLLDKTTEI